MVGHLELYLIPPIIVRVEKVRKISSSSSSVDECEDDTVLIGWSLIIRSNCQKHLNISIEKAIWLDILRNWMRVLLTDIYVEICRAACWEGCVK